MAACASPLQPRFFSSFFGDRLACSHVSLLRLNAGPHPLIYSLTLRDFFLRSLQPFCSLCDSLLLFFVRFYSFLEEASLALSSLVGKLISLILIGRNMMVNHKFWFLFFLYTREGRLMKHLWIHDDFVVCLPCNIIYGFI